jgi:hypothetical protein
MIPKKPAIGKQKEYMLYFKRTLEVRSLRLEKANYLKE